MNWKWPSGEKDPDYTPSTQEVYFDSLGVSTYEWVPQYDFRFRNGVLEQSFCSTKNYQVIRWIPLRHNDDGEEYERYGYLNPPKAPE